MRRSGRLFPWMRRRPEQDLRQEISHRLAYYMIELVGG
jgi:hypothetical protein